MPCIVVLIAHILASWITMTIDLSQYVQILVCPSCRSNLFIDKQSVVCRSAECRRKFLVKDDIPVMLADDAQTLSPDEWSALVANQVSVAS